MLFCRELHSLFSLVSRLTPPHSRFFLLAAKEQSAYAPRSSRDRYPEKMGPKVSGKNPTSMAAVTKKVSKKTRTLGAMRKSTSFLICAVVKLELLEALLAIMMGFW